MEAQSVDERLDFIGSFVQKTMKLKPEKWTKMIGQEEARNAVMDFLDRGEPPVLVIMLNSAAQLVPLTAFPINLKSKAAYFARVRREPVTATNMRSLLVVGDLAVRPIEELAALVDEVFVPLLSNPTNHGAWPVAVAQDVRRHVHSLKSTVYQVKGQVSGQTVLPMPVGVERVHEAERQLTSSGGEVVDLYLKSAIEGVVIKWATQINDVLTEDSSQAFLGSQTPTPAVEIHFWNARLSNLENIYDQLKEEKVRKMAVILEKTDSAYFPCFKNLFRNIIGALAEARDIALHLKPLQRHLTALEDVADFAEAGPLLRPLMHTVCLVWAHSRYYCHSSKLIVLLRQICNLIIQQAKRYLDPSSIFQSDVDEAKQRIQLSISILLQFRNIFDSCRENLGYFFKEREPVLWNFHPKMVFERYQAFLDRLQIVESFFDTVLEFLKLEKVEIGGLKGRVLSAKITHVFRDFNEHFAVFACKTYDALDPEDEAFIEDYSAFQLKVTDLDRRLASILCQSFDDCHELEGIFKLISIVGSVLDRPLIKDEFTSKYKSIVSMLDAEITTAEEIYEERMTIFEKFNRMPVDKNMPPLAGSLAWSFQLAQRVTIPVGNFRALDHPVVASPEAKSVLERFEALIEKLGVFEHKLFEVWASRVSEQCEEKLKRSLLKRLPTKELALNFDPEVILYFNLFYNSSIPYAVKFQQLESTLREAHYLQLRERSDVPESALALYARSETFRKYTCNLNITIERYNKIRRQSKPVEFELVREHVEEIDELVDTGRSSLDWNSPELWSYIEKLRDLVCGLHQRLQQTQDNVERIGYLMATWSRSPVFERKDSKKDTLLYPEDQPERAQRRYAEISEAAVEIHRLLGQNLELFGMQSEVESSRWLTYVAYVDDIVSDGLLCTVGCSLAYIADNMDPHNVPPPLFEARLELQEPNLIFVPPLDDTSTSEPDSPRGYPVIVRGLIEQIVRMATLIPRVASQNKDTLHYEEDMHSNNDINEMQVEMMEEVKVVMKEARDFCANFETYAYLWFDDRQLYMDLFLRYGRQLTLEEMDLVTMGDAMAPEETPPSMELFKQQIDSFECVFNEVEALAPEQVFHAWFQVDIRPFKQALLNTIRKWGNMFKQHLADRVTTSLSDLAEFIHEADEGLLRPLADGDYDGLVRLMGYLMNVKERQAATDDMFEPLQDTIELLKFYDQELPEEVHVLLQELPEQWQNTKKIAVTVKQLVAPMQANEVACIRKRISAFDGQQFQYRDTFRKSDFLKFECRYPYRLMDETNTDIEELETVMEKIHESASLFEVNHLWDYIFIVRTSIEDWKTTPWRKIDVENMDIECKKFAKEVRALDKEMRMWDAYIALEATVKNMLTSLRAVGELQNPAIRERHWQQLMTTTKVRFVMDMSTTLADLLALNLHECEEEVKNIVDKAVKEMSMEKILKELNATWSTMEFEQERHARTGCQLLRASEELIETLEENQVQLQNLITSKFIAHFLEEVSAWQNKLSIADQVITLWFEVQRTWMHLESIFMSSEDIRRQLPQDSARFDKIDTDFKVLMEEMSKTPRVVQATNQLGLMARLEELQRELTLCEKALAEYLETKRLAFPRFYFVSSADLLDILSNGNQAKLVVRHLTKLFDSMARLKFVKAETEEQERTQTTTGMYAKDGEFVEFNATCDCMGPVEVWLNRLQSTMRSTIRNSFAEAVVAYEEKARELWLFDYPAQVSLCGTQIWWTSEVNMAFARLEEGYDNAIKDYQKKQISQLSTLISLLLGELTKQDRQKIMTICTIDVHSRDVVAKLIQSKVESSSAFQWQSQLRHRWDEKERDCFANICDAQFRYSHEYLGNTPRLVITPLTDRCYITLTQSLHLVMGGGPAGPAGTGKTETTKDLGRALGIMVYVFNCSEQMDYKSCGNIYKGLAQTGAWGCFDEFNRISVEVLSVVAVQVKSVQDAIREKKKTFNFMGEMIALEPSVGIFITMNPGYAGRTELPENLKALFRILARKFITLYTLCKELLSKQDHYDWGLRAIKSVLVVAGSLKARARGDPGRPEEEVLMRALRDFNVPKVVTDDVPVFMGLIGDLFPALDVPRKRDLEFERTVKQAASDLKLQPEDNFILKVVQLEELLEVRHSVFVVGNAGTGKTQVWKTLYRTYQNIKKKPVFNDLNPKAVTNDELFGIINPATREWKDGLLSVLMREQANLLNDSPKWIVLDGDIDPMWIESLNTVMDDNKVLTLASNERIALTPHMRLLFEISNLRTATPATVSRAGILYINPQDLGWNPYVTSWIETRTLQSEKTNLVILFDKYIPPCVETIRTRFKKVTPIAEISHIQMLCHLLRNLLTPENTPPDCNKDWYEVYFVFACVWAFGACMFQDQAIDYRAEFSKWWVNEFKAVKFPSTGTVFDYFIDTETKQFVPWTEKLPRFELDPDMPLQAVLVHTAESIRIRYFLDLLMAARHPVMLVGGAGCGKTVLVSEKLAALSDTYAVANVPFNFYTTSEMLQKILEKPLEKKAGRNYGPPGNKTLIYFIDDMNMPEVDSYGTVQPHTLIRQHLDYNHWYDRTKLSLKDIHNTQYVSCMNPTAGSFSINPRLQRHFCVFAVSFPCADSLNTIYQSILSQHMSNLEHRFPYCVTRLTSNVVSASLALHLKVSQVFLPTAIKFHYIFNLRDLSNVFQGLLFSTADCLNIPTDFVRLWMHETQRVYGDKLVDEKDIEQFAKIQGDIIKKNFEEIDETLVAEKPNIYCHFAQGIGEPKYMSIGDWGSLNKLLQEAMLSYNDLVAAMNLVLFEDAMMHVCRINRILESPRGSALLVGVGGSGKQSLARLAAFISSLEVAQIQLRKGYSVSDLKTELSGLYLKAGLKNVGIMFLMTDAQVPNENFLVLINDMLASGEIPDLFPDDEVENIIAGVRNEVKGAGMLDTRENCWKFFIDRVRRQLKVVLCFSPVGNTLRVRSRKFPAIINCTAINWFHEWPQEALVSVSRRFLQELDVLPEANRDSASRFMAFVHTAVNGMSRVYLQNERRYNYTTPKSYLEQISLYAKLLRQKTVELRGKVERLENGLEKLKSTAEQVDDLKAKLAVQEIELKQKNDAADALIEIVGIETEKVSKEKMLADEEEEKVARIAEEVTKKQQDCEEDLAKAEPALLAAQEALNTLNKSFGSPPGAVTNVTAAVMVLLAPAGKIPKDRSWKAAKIVMAKVDQFLDALITYDKENIHPEIMKAIQPYLKDSEFEPEFVRSKSAAAAGLCAWVINIIKFYEVYCDVEPKRKALAQANAELAAAQDKLSVIKRKVASLEEQLAKLTADFEQATAEKLRCQEEADATSRTIALANRLVGGLASENVRWAESVASFMKQATTLPGDVLLVTAFISYVGCFTKQFRHDLVNKMWLPFLKTLEPPIPITENLDPLSLLTDDAQIATWNNEGLPSDRMSAENATILENSDRWPLMIDPQLQGVKWIRMKYGEDLRVIRLGMKGYLEVIEKALTTGATVLVENIGESVDPVLDPLLGRNLIKKGRAIKIGDKEVEYNPKFRLILHTKMANPHYKPEMQAQTTLINFTVTRDGLEDQLLAEVVKAERPDLEDLKAELTKQQNDFKIMLKTLEDDLLSRLSSAGGNLLGDTALVENLETTKRTAAEIEVKVAEARVTSSQIDVAREHYRPAAARASLLYFILNDLNTINPIYQFSLKILLMNEEINVAELDFLLRFPVTPHVHSPVDFLSNTSWGGIRSLASRDEFRNLDRDIECSPKRWKKLVESECPEKEKFPQEWKNKTPLQKLCMMRALRPDRMTYALKVFIEEKLGSKYVEGRTVEFSKSFEETSPSTPIFFILSPGVNPLKDVESLGRKMGFTTDLQNFHNVSLGQGQEVVAEEAMEISAKMGHWVVLQNIHLVKKWLPALEKNLEHYSEGSHPDYRVFMSAEPAATAAAHIIPQGILESSIKITNEPPTGMNANLHKALENFNQETLEMSGKEAEFKAILFSLCYFHAVVAERRKFGPQGWNRVYPFNVGDLNICVSVMFNYLEASAKVPWEDLRYLFGEIMYGGHITDDWDRRLCNSYLEELMQPDL
ncbi:hypothetical protein B566_EDAN005192, partial [Ephemera danica]